MDNIAMMEAAEEPSSLPPPLPPSPRSRRDSIVTVESSVRVARKARRASTFSKSRSKHMGEEDGEDDDELNIVATTDDDDLYTSPTQILLALGYGLLFLIPVLSLTGSRNEESTISCLDTRRQLSDSYFKLFNKSVFKGKLPLDTAVVWNKRLLTTAGRCLQAEIGTRRRAFIQLSCKICDTEERIRDTLIHEMCHAATWLIDGIQHTDHNACFQYWADRAERIHPSLPQINSFHNYHIRTKYTYRCKSCSNSVGRHTKSLDTKNKVCALCGGRFQLEGDDGHPSGKAKRSSSAYTTSSTIRTSRNPRRKGRFANESFAHYINDNLRGRRHHGSYSRFEIVKKLAKEFDKLAQSCVD